MKKIQLILAGFVACSLSLFAETMTVSITPLGDTWVRKNNTDKKGSAGTMEIRTKGTDDDFVGLLSFAMPQLPENARITAAHLFVTTERIKDDGGINIFPLNQDFDENTVVYADVADAIATARANGKIASFTAKGQWNKACSVDVIDDANYQTIDAWCNDINITHYVKSFTETNLNVFLSSNKTDQANPSCYFTKEATGHVKGEDNKGLTYTAEQVCPKLVITYTTDPYAQMAGPQSLKVTFNGTDNDGWAADVTSSSVENGILSATQDQSGDKYRGDLKFNKSGDKTFKLNPEVDKYLAIKFVGQRPAGNLKMEFKNIDGTWCNNTWNGGNPTSKPGANGTVYYFNLTSNANYMSGHLDADGNFVVSNLNFIIADNTTDDHTYQVDWIATFASVEDIQAWVDWNDQIAYAPQYPAYEFGYRPKTDNTWDSGTPKSGWSNDKLEMRYGSRLFVIQAYRIKDYQADAIYTLKLNKGNAAGELGAWNFPYADIPVVSSQSAATLCNYAKEVTGIGMDMQGTKKDPIATATCAGNVWTFTIPGYCLTPISVDAEGYSWVSVLITTPDLTNSNAANAHLTTCMSSNSTDKFSTLEKTGTFSAAIGNTTYATIQDALSAATNGDVITVFANQEISAFINTNDRALTIQGYTGKEVLIRKSGYTDIMFLTTNNSNAALTVKNLIVDGNNVANTKPVFEASNGKTTTIENVIFRNVTSSNGYGSVICNKGGGVLVMKDIQFENCICTSETTPSLVFFGTSYATIKGNFQTTNCGNVPMIRVESKYNFAAADLTNTEPITIQLDQHISGNKIVSGYTDASKFQLYNAPLFVLKSTGTDLNLQSLNVRNETTGEVYTTLAEAVAAAESNDVLTVCQDIEISSARIEITKALTIQGATGQEKIICGVNASTLMVLANGNTADYTVTFKNLIVDGQNKTRSIQTFDTNYKAKMCFDGVSVINTTYSEVTGDVKCNGNSIILTGNNSFATGIYLNKTKRIENNNATHTEPIQLILASDYEENYAIVLTCDNASLYTAKDAAGYYWKLNVTLSGTKYELKGEKTPWQYDLTVSDAGMATLVLGFDATLPEGVKAYQLTNDGTNVIEATSVNAITKNEPVLVVAPAGVYTFAASEKEVLNEQADPKSGCLIGSYKSINVPECTDGVYNYILAVGGEGVGFYQVADGSCTIGKNRAYLSCAYNSQAGNGNKGPMRISFIEQSTTNLERTQVEGTFKKVMMDNQILILREGHLYRIDGQKVK